MQINIQRTLLRYVVLMCALSAPDLFAKGYSLALVPDWIVPAQLPHEEMAEKQNNSNGIAYLLVDRQWQVIDGQQNRYTHIASKALNASGVEASSQISIDFDPEYESLTLHQVLIRRDGQTLDRLPRSSISVIQREKDLDYHIYDGTKTLNIFIEDVRVGDVVEYSYSIEGVNPVLSQHFSQQLRMSWSAPVGRIHYRLLWPMSRPLHIRTHETDINPVARTLGEYTEYVWQQDEVEELIEDEDTPDWYDPFPVVYLSDFDSWEEVDEWARPLYQPMSHTPAVQTVIASIVAENSTHEQRVLKALRFVQDEIRYLGIEMGARSHKPNDPDTVIRQRYGDCKDKSRLLVSLLQGMDVEANSVLVNSTGDLQANKPLPTPTVFDHAIVRVQIDDRTYWLDPTRSFQYGNLDARYQPDYDQVLVISGADSSLTNMSDDITHTHSKVVEETFDISNAMDRPASYRITSHFNRYYADEQRKQWLESNPGNIQKSFLNYLSSYYPDIEVNGQIEYADDEKLNRLSLTEHYSIPKVWTLSDDERHVYVSFRPYLIYDHIKSVETRKRSMPYAVTHPVRYQHTSRIRVPEGSSFDSELAVVQDTAFHFTRKVDFSDNVLVIEYLYESLDDHVKKEDIQTHAENISKVHDLAFYQVYMTNPAIDFGKYQFYADDINWIMVLITSLGLLSTVLLSYKYLYYYDPPYKVPEKTNIKLEGLTGWLILPALILIFTPFRVLLESEELWYIFSAQQWSILQNEYGAGLLGVIVMEFICNIAVAVIALFLLVQFFTRRHTFPKFILAYFIFLFAVTATDLLVLHLMAIPGLDISATDIGDLTRLGLYAVIWSLYFVNSERVKSTFTHHRVHRVSEQSVTTEIMVSATDYAGFWIRLGAFMIDLTIMVVVLYVPLSLIYGEQYWLGEQLIHGFWDVLLGYVIPIVATIWFWLYFFGTPGKMATRLKIVDAKTRNKLSLGQAIGRYFSYIPAMLPVGLGLFWIGIDKKKQGWHDKLAGTVVIRSNESR